MRIILESQLRQYIKDTIIEEQLKQIGFEEFPESDINACRRDGGIFEMRILRRHYDENTVRNICQQNGYIAIGADDYGNYIYMTFESIYGRRVFPNGRYLYHKTNNLNSVLKYGLIPQETEINFGYHYWCLRPPRIYLFESINSDRLDNYSGEIVKIDLSQLDNIRFYADPMEYAIYCNVPIVPEAISPI